MRTVLVVVVVLLAACAPSRAEVLRSEYRESEAQRPTVEAAKQAEQDERAMRAEREETARRLALASIPKRAVRVRLTNQLPEVILSIFVAGPAGKELVIPNHRMVSGETFEATGDVQTTGAVMVYGNVTTMGALVRMNDVTLSLPESNVLDVVIDFDAALGRPRLNARGVP